jgi:hypothetical protein
MPNYCSLVPGGYFSSTPMDKSTGPVTKRCNNPGAINGASWETTYPGYFATVETTPGNRSTIFEAPEYGVGAWWDLLRRYEARNAATVGGIITTYGGGQDYSAYLQFVLRQTGFSAGTVIDLNNDQQVLQFGRAMFRYEAGQALPWSDDQILYGIRGGRQYANTQVWPSSPSLAAPTRPVPGPVVTPPVPGPVVTAPVPGPVVTAPVPGPVVTAPVPGPVVTAPISNSDLLALLQKLLVALAGGATSPPSAIAVDAKPAIVGADSSAASSTPASPVLTSIDKVFGGEALVGYKTIIGVIGYVIVAILQAAGVLGTATPAGQILSVLTIAFAALGGLSKIDRMTQSLLPIANAK